MTFIIAQNRPACCRSLALRRAAGVTPYTAFGLTLVKGESGCLES